MTKVIVLGSGTAVSSFYKPFDFRAPPGYLLEHNGKQYLVECSEGIRARLEKIKVDYYSVSNILISHFHPDHFSLLPFVQSLYVRARWAMDKKQINIYGPRGIEKKFRTFWELSHYKGSYEERIIPFLDINFFEFETGKTISLDKGLELTPYFVRHESGRMQSYAMRFKIENRVFAYSGDCGPCQGATDVSRGADVFLCECSAGIGTNSSEYGHFNPYQAGQMALKNNVKTLVLSHLTGQNSPRELLTEVARSGYTGEVKIASDLDMIYIRK